eukprot:2222631-Alexandrium_andersonii.AAC.1
MAAATFAPRCAWGVLMGGQLPSSQQRRAYARAFRVATRGTANPRGKGGVGGQASVRPWHHDRHAHGVG